MTENPPLPEMPEPPQLPELPEPQTLELMLPLSAAARARVGEQVVVHIVGGMQVAGRLSVVDVDDASITLIQGGKQYDVALQSVAIIEGDR